MYGAGTKLPHNVIGLLGVANGVEGDLRTGLPSQMIEVHEPSRLLILVEQDTTILNAALSRIEQFRPWLDNEWVRLASCHPVTKDVQFYSSSGWNLINLPKDFDTPTAVCSTEIYPGLTETIPVHILTGEAA